MLSKTLFELPHIKRTLFILSVLTLLKAFLIVGQAYSLTVVLTELWHGNQISDNLTWLAIFFSCFVAIKIVSYIVDAILDSYAHKQATSLREKLLKKIFTLGPEIVQKHGTGSTTTLVLEGTDQVETYIRIILPKITAIVIIPIAILICVYPLDWVSGIIITVVFPFIILYMVIFGKTAQEKSDKQFEKHKILSNHFIDSLRGIDTLRYFGLSKSHGQRIYQVSENFRESTVKTLRIATLSSSVLDLFATLSLAAVALMLGLRLMDGSMLIFPAMLALVLVPDYFLPVREFAADYHASLDGKNSLNAIMNMLDKSEAYVSKTSIPKVDGSTRVSFKNLSFSYNSFEALSDITFQSSGQEKIGIVGLSGSGKSTLIDILGGFKTPKSGEITVSSSHHNQATVDTLNNLEWQQQVMYIPQNPYIFHASFKENLTFYYPEASDDEIERAIEVAGLNNVLKELPQGSETIIGEGGRTLSGGQAQRIALARAFLDKSRTIFLFDEPTAHLDIETEVELKERMLPLMENKLVFLATHRLHWMKDMDKILVLDQGKVVEFGSMDDLVKKNGAFTHLVKELQGGDVFHE